MLMQPAGKKNRANPETVPARNAGCKLPSGGLNHLEQSTNHRAAGELLMPTSKRQTLKRLNPRASGKTDTERGF